MSKGLEHWLGTAAEEMLWRGMLLQELSDEAVVAEAAVVGGEVDGRAGQPEIVHACKQVRATNAVVERHVLHTPTRRLAVAAGAEQFSDVGEKRRLADAAGD